MSAYAFFFLALSIVNCMFQKAISSLNLALELWQVCTNSYAIILSRIPTHCLRSFFLISIPGFLRIFLTIRLMKILKTNQSDRSTPRFLHSILTIQSISPKHFSIFLVSFPVQLQTSTRDVHETVKNCRRPRTTGNQESRPGGPTTLGSRRSWPATLVVYGAQTPSTPRTTGATADG